MSDPADEGPTHPASKSTNWLAVIGQIPTLLSLPFVLLVPWVIPPQVLALAPVLFLFLVLLNLLGLFASEAEHKRGGGLAIAGVLISLFTVILVAQPKFDPGCLRARYALRNSPEVTQPGDPETTEKKLQELITDLRHAEAAARASYVKDAVEGLRGDYETLLHEMQTGNEAGTSQAPPTTLDMYTRMLNIVCTSGSP
jgi:hypothetical protein